MNFFTQIEFFTIFPLNFHHVHFHTTTIPSVNRNLKVHSTHFVRKLDHPLFAKNQLNKRNIVPNDRLNRKGHGIVWSNGNRISRSTGSPANRMFRVPSSAGLISTTCCDLSRQFLTRREIIIVAWTRTTRIFIHLGRVHEKFNSIAPIWSAILSSYMNHIYVCALYMYERRSIRNAARAGRHIAGNDTRYVLVDWRGLCSVSRVKLKSVLRLLRSLTEIDRSFKVVFSNNATV